ncbi:MAG TPA: IPT/TIG domain-containing protein [Bryobacteraceae bacterium]|nr:IPT/TIG domain-containing protein [Bryobacteraceae bacterium]
MIKRGRLACWFLGMLAAAPGLHATSTGGLLLETAGTITSDPAEVVDGTRSIKGSYSGSGSYTPYLRSDPGRLPLQPNQTYQITFRYKILSTANKGFEVLFYSPTGGQHGSFLPSQVVSGAVGSTGTATLSNTLGPFTDYQARWNVIGTGSIAVDDIQIVNVSTGAVIAIEDAEPGTLLLSTFFVSASKPAFVWGEPVKVTARLYDETGKAIAPGPVSWTVAPANAASVAPDGTVTPQRLTMFTVNAAAAGSSGQVLMQALPKSIAVTPERTPMLVGSTQKMHADVLDVNGQPIPNPGVSWNISSDYYNFSPSATIDSSGVLTGVRQARVRVVATIPYPQQIPGFDAVAQGDTLVDIQAPVTYRFQRIFVSKASGAPASKLAPRPAPLIPTESGGFMFAASLDGLGSALLEWNNGNLSPLLTSGRVNLVNGYPLANFVSYGRTSSGQVLVQEVDTSGSQLVSRGPAGSITPMLARGSAVFGASNTSTFAITRNSIADSGAMLINVGYTDAVTHLYTQGLYRGSGFGISEPVINNRDSRIANGDVSGWFDTWGTASDGTAWFEGGSTSTIWRSRPGQAPEKLLSRGDALGDATVGGYLVNYSATDELFFAANNGDSVNAVYTNKGTRVLLWHEGDTTPSAVLAVNVNGLYWYDPNLGALLDATPAGKTRGLYLWNSDGTTPLLLLNDSSVDGSPVQEILSATNTADGTVYAMLRTANNPMVIARLIPNPQILLQSGDSVPVSVPPVITALIPGARSGVPMVIAGGGSGSIARLDSSGITPVIAVGARLPDGKYFAGSASNMVRTTPDGRIVFAEDYFAQDSSLYTWNQGTIELTVRAPLKNPDGSNAGAPRNIEINRQGDVAFQTSWNGGAVYRIRGGNVTKAMDRNPTLDNVTVQNPTVRGMDDTGNIVFNGTKVDGSSFYLGMWDGNAAHVILSPGQNLPDGRQVTSIGTAKACTDSFVVGVLGTFARYRNGNWSYLTDLSQNLATGAPANQLGIFDYDADRNCDLVFQDGGGGLGAFAGSQYRELQDLQQLTPNGDLLSVSQMLINDDATVYILGANDQGEEVLYLGTPVAAGAGGGSTTTAPQEAAGPRSPANGATYTPGGLVPGSWAQVQGTNLSDAVRIWAPADFTDLLNTLPTNLNGVEVTVNGIAAAVYYISPTQVNFQVPNVDAGPATVEVIRNGAAGPALSANIVTSAPGIFPIAAGGKNYAAGVFLDGKFAGDPALGSSFRKARPGETIQLFATGLVPSPAGVTVSFQPVSGVTVKLGDITVPADAAGLVAVGQFQINFTVPPQYAALGEGDYPVSIQINGVSSPATINSDPPGPLVIPIQH